MSEKTITLQIPDELFESLRETAVASERPIETVMLESLNVLFQRPSLATNIEALLLELRAYTDEQLWAVVYRRLPWTQSLRLHELAAKGKQGFLTETETTELEQLVDLNDRYMLLRSEALLLLKQRGQDINPYLKLSA